MADAYTTIVKPSEASMREKMSKFISFAHPVFTVDEAKEVIATYQKKYYDATHVCWAYMLGADRLTFQSNDNGEPSGTAGKPILGQINSMGLSNVVVIVVRYFGGIKLGTSGLIAAYRESARLVLEEAEKIECHETEGFTFTFPYMVMNDVMKVIKTSDVEITDRDFNTVCTMTVTTPSDKLEVLKNRINDIDGVSIH